MGTTLWEVQKSNARGRDVAPRRRQSTRPFDPSNSDALEELFAWGAKVATEHNLTVKELDAILKEVRDRLRK